MHAVSPISKGEFLHLLQRCIPPGGWPSRIAVANSGGPDSVCLLHLLASTVKRSRKSAGLPEKVLSVHVNHGLQAASQTMSDIAKAASLKIGVTHSTVVIPWGTGVFPQLPADGDAFEEVARDARYRRLFRSMVNEGAHVIAYGHHADDQVETAVMRIALGSSDLGASGMRSVRRWGMGQHRPLTLFGAEGMSRWIVRPLLTVPKARILATCEKNQLPYVNDPSNFQPSATLRNAIRQRLAQPDSGKSADLAKEPSTGERPDITAAIRRLAEMSPAHPGVDGLRDAVRALGQRVEMTDTRVSEHLATSMYLSVPSTVLLKSHRLSRITDPDLRIAIVRRILRYVSPRLWGSVEAEARGNRRGLEQIVQNVWGTLENPAVRRAFSGGANVVWIPGVAWLDGHFKRSCVAGPQYRPAWLVQRARPMSNEKLKGLGQVNPLFRDITEDVRSLMTTKDSQYILYDARFHIRLDFKSMPAELVQAIAEAKEETRILLEPHTSLFTPRLIWRRIGHPDETLAYFAWARKEAKEVLRLDSSWVQMRCIRTLEAI